MAKKKLRGGKREGAGRKPSSPDGPTILVAVTVPEVLMDKLDVLAYKNAWNRSKAVTEAIRGLVATPKRG
jgi:hypothetical protein